MELNKFVENLNKNIEDINDSLDKSAELALALRDDSLNILKYYNIDYYKDSFIEDILEELEDNNEYFYDWDFKKELKKYLVSIKNLTEDDIEIIVESINIIHEIEYAILNKVVTRKINNIKHV